MSILISTNAEDGQAKSIDRRERPQKQRDGDLCDMPIRSSEWKFVFIYGNSVSKD